MTTRNEVGTENIHDKVGKERSRSGKKTSMTRSGKRSLSEM